MDDLQIIPKYRTIWQTAIRLNVSRRTVMRLIDKKKLKAVRPNYNQKGVQVTVESIIAYEKEIESIDIDDIEMEEFTKKTRRVIYKGVG